MCMFLFISRLQWVGFLADILNFIVMDAEGAGVQVVVVEAFEITYSTTLAIDLARCVLNH